MRAFDAEKAMALLSDRSLAITYAFGVPTDFLLMTQSSQFDTADLSHVVCLAVGRAPSPITLLNAFIAKGIAIQQSWGMTETATIGTMLSRDAVFSKLGSAGRPVMHAQLRILDEDQNDVTPGAVGQLAIRGLTVTSGYWRQPVATEKSFSGEWFLTGDAARNDEDGFRNIVDRWSRRGARSAPVLTPPQCRLCPLPQGIVGDSSRG
jgi:fatty-acyl-CoA synthase